jgi:3-hydroxyacyl-[acyl-carrier-protein] dehydratase
MATDFVLNLDELDLSRVAFDAKALDHDLPQVGHLRMCDAVLWHNEDFTQGVGRKDVRHDEFWVPCHIPGRPLLPGVLMIEAGAQLASFMQKNKYNREGFLGFTRCDDTVFRGQVVPGDTLYLAGQEVESTARRFISRVQGLVNGKIVFESTVTGMIM